MINRSTDGLRALPWWRDGDRCIVIYLWVSVAIVLAGGAMIALKPAWVESGLLGFDNRWSRRLERGEALLAAGQYEGAVDYLQQLEHAFPAQSIKHKRDMQRERLLVALSDALLATGRQGRSIDALKRLAAYDPNNVANHYQLGCALRADRDEDAARLAFENVLRIAPYHLDAARQLMEMAYEGGRFAAVVETWDRYLNATRFATLEIRAANQATLVDVVADGSIQSVSVPVNLSTGFSGELLIELGASSVDRERDVRSDLVARSALLGDHPPFVIIQADLVTPGRFGERIQQDIQHGLPAPAAVIRHGVWSIPIGPLASGAARLDLTVRVLVTAGAPTWDIVERSHRNMLAYDALEAVRSRIDIQ